MKPLEAGARTRYRAIPTRAEAASALGNTGVDAVSTQALIIYLEHACHSLMAPNYAPGEGSVGFKVAVEHLAPAFPGAPVDVDAVLSQVSGRRFVFEVSLRQCETVVMRGSHTRVVVDLARFRAKTSAAFVSAAAASKSETVDFWFDFNSPWCYLASLRIGPLARLRGLEVNWRPVHLAKLSARIDGRRPLEENPAFVSWYREDLNDFAALQGVVVNYHPKFPLRPSRALRASLHAADEELAGEFVNAVMKAYWSENADIEDPATLASVGKTVGLSSAQLMQVLADKKYKARLEANLEEAVESSIFGLPMTIFRGKRYFGNDRLDLLERHLDSAG
ncbi:MAG TPA: DsbA family protein [Gammaproteobacteria bacterium]|nr:DsbA family protein [Gammaproteobacteria bacterium]